MFPGPEMRAMVAASWRFGRDSAIGSFNAKMGAVAHGRRSRRIWRALRPVDNVKRTLFSDTKMNRYELLSEASTLFYVALTCEDPEDRL